MATDFTQDEVLVFLQRSGGSAKNTELLAHFLPFLRDNPDNVGNRDLFKSFVNSVATVSKIDGVSTVILRKKFRGYVSGGGSGRDSAEPGPVGSSSSLTPPGDTDRNPALPAAGIQGESGTRLRYTENPSPEPVQVRNQLPEPSGIPYQSRTEEQNRLDSDPAVRHQDYIPEPIRWQEIPQESFVPAPIRRQEAPHQDRFPEPIRGQDYQPIGGHVDYTPRPTGRYEVPQQDVPHMPSRRLDKPHQGTVPEPLRGHIVGRQDHAPDPGERWDPPNQGTVSEPNKGRIVSRQDHAPEPIRGQKTSHQNRNAAPFRGHVGNRQDHFPGPVRGQQVLHQSPFPAPNRRWDAAPQDLRGYVISRVPEPIRGQNVFYQDPSRDPLKGSQPPTSQPPRGQQSFYQVPQNPEHLRGWEIPYQDPIPEYLSGQQVPQNLEPLRIQRVPHQVLQNLEPLRVQRVPQQIPEHLRGREIPYEDPVPEAQNIFYQNPIPEHLSGHQVPQNLEPLRGQQMSYDPVPEHIRGQEIYFSDSNPDLHKGQKISYQDPIPEYLSGQQIPQNPERLLTTGPPEPERNPEPLQRQQVPQNLEPLQRQQVPQNLEPLQRQQVPQNLEPLQRQQVPQNLELLQRQQVPQNLEPLQRQQVPQNLEPLQRQQVPQNLEPHKGQQIFQSPELRKAHQKNLEPPKEQQVPQNLEPLKGQLVPKSPERRREQKISFQDLVPESPKGQQSPPQDPEPAPQLHQAPVRRFRLRQSYRSAVSQDDDDKEEEDVQIRRGSAGGQWPLNAPLSDEARAMSASSPCVIESLDPPSSSSANKVPQIYIQNSDVELLASPSHSESRSRPEPGPVPVESMRRSLPLEAEFNTERHHDKRAARTSEPIRSDQNQRLSSSQSDLFDPPSAVRSSVSDWPPSGSSRTFRADEPAVSSTSLDVLQESNRTKPEPPARRSNLKMPFHQSMGNLCDDVSPPSRKLPLYLSSDHLNDTQQYASRGSSLDQSTDELYDDMKSSNSSIDSPRVKLRSAAARRMSSRLRNRICRSLGTDLDQEEAGGGLEDPRLERLHRISSLLSLPHHLSSSSLSLSSCTTPPRCPSPIASEGGRKESRKSLNSHKQSAFPLEAQEHDWIVKAAAASWPDIYTLFRSDSSLLNRQDFISGFTVLHWMAKHGDHRVINTLWYGVEQKGLSFDVNAKSTAGQTALHIAAIHGHKNIIRLLVKKFKADVKLRDMAGKKAWQYLSDPSPDILELLAAPPKAALTIGAENADPGLKPPKQRRHLRHHFSSASPGQRPQTLAAVVKVNRSSSIAALLKHKSLHRF